MEKTKIHKSIVLQLFLVLCFTAVQPKAHAAFKAVYLPGVYEAGGTTAEDACVNLVNVLNNSIDFDGLTFVSIISSDAGASDTCAEYPSSYPACKMGNGQGGSGYCTGFAPVSGYEDKKDYTIEILPASDNPKSAAILASVQPKNAVGLIAEVRDEFGVIQKGISIELEVSVKSNSGGHQHDDVARHTDHAGVLSGTPVSQNTVSGITGDEANPYGFTFTAPAPAGDHKIRASCTSVNCTQIGRRDLWAGVEGLETLSSGSANYTLIGSTSTHPNNHYVTKTNKYKAVILASLYKSEFPSNPVLHYNDGSLERGGVFDFNSAKTWAPPHKTHREGNDLDVRANPEVNPQTAIPKENFFEFVDLVAVVGASASIHNADTNNQHFHINF